MLSYGRFHRLRQRRAEEGQIGKKEWRVRSCRRASASAPVPKRKRDRRVSEGGGSVRSRETWRGSGRGMIQEKGGGCKSRHSTLTPSNREWFGQAGSRHYGCEKPTCGRTQRAAITRVFNGRRKAVRKRRGWSKQLGQIPGQAGVQRARRKSKCQGGGEGIGRGRSETGRGEEIGSRLPASWGAG